MFRIKDGLCIFFILALLPHFYYTAQPTRCLHRGCKMSPGLTQDRLNTTLYKLLTETEKKFQDNIIKISTWNLKLDDKSRNDVNAVERMVYICDYIIQLDPTVFGLQEVLEWETEDLKNCLREYVVLRGHGRQLDGNDRSYNVMIIKKSDRVSVIESGSFWLGSQPWISKTNINGSSATCTWARISVAERKTEFPNFFKNSFEETSANPLLQYMMGLFIKKGANSKNEKIRKMNIIEIKNFRKRKQNVIYQWFDFYVAVTQFDNRDENIAKEQAESLTYYLRNTVMDRRHYPILVLGDFGFEDNSKIYEYFHTLTWLKNSMLESRHKYPSLTLHQPDENKKEGLVDYIWYNKFKGIMSAALTDDELKRLSNYFPIFSALFSTM